MMSRSAARRQWLGPLLLALLSVGLLGLGFWTQYRSSKPIGDGEILEAGANRSAELWPALRAELGSIDRAVRSIRNTLDIEAVALIDVDGHVLASTSVNQVGQVFDDPVLLNHLEEGEFIAYTNPLSEPLLIDSEVRWPAEYPLYQVVAPVEEGALLLYYDLHALNLQTLRVSRLQAEAAALVVAALVAAFLLFSILRARMLAARRAAAAQITEERSRELEVNNARLEEARGDAERALALAEETNRVRSEFVLMINHELRTPLTSVVTGARVLLEELPAEDREAILHDMIRDGERLADLMAQMLTVARLENRNRAFDLVNCRAEHLLDDLARACQLDGVELDRSLVAVTDRAGLLQVLMILIDNARKHGATNVRVRVGSLPLSGADLSLGHVPNPGVHWLVDDDGPGFDKSFLPEAFGKFSKGSRSSGTGLGLYFASMITKALRGSIAVRTGPGGTQVDVTVPAAIATQAGVAA